MTQITNKLIRIWAILETTKAAHDSGGAARANNSDVLASSGYVRHFATGV